MAAFLAKHLHSASPSYLSSIKPGVTTSMKALPQPPDSATHSDQLLASTFFLEEDNFEKSKLAITSCKFS